MLNFVEKKGNESPKGESNGDNKGNFVQRMAEAKAQKAENAESGKPKTWGVRDKAEYIVKHGLSDKNFNTLRGYSHAELDSIIESNGEKAETPRASVESVKSVINIYIDLCEAVKEARCGEKIKDSLKSLALKSAPHLAVHCSAKLIGALIFGGGLLAFILIFFDAVFGLENIKQVFTFKRKVKNTEPNLQGNPTGKPLTPNDVIEQLKRERNSNAI